MIPVLPSFMAKIVQGEWRTKKAFGFVFLIPSRLSYSKCGNLCLGKSAFCEIRFSCATERQKGIQRSGSWQRNRKKRRLYSIKTHRFCRLYSIKKIKFSTRKVIQWTTGIATRVTTLTSAASPTSRRLVAHNSGTWKNNSGSRKK